MKKIEHDYEFIPRPLKLVASSDQLSRVMEFRRSEYSKRYHSIQIANHDPYDRFSHILYAENEQGEINSTARLVMDSEIGLPEDRLFPPMIEEYRQEGKRLMEIGRFIINDGNQQLLKKYYQAFYQIGRASNVDYVAVVMRHKDMAFHKKLFGIDVLIENIGENFGSDLKFMCVGWDLDNTRPAFFKWINR